MVVSSASTEFQLVLKRKGKKTIKLSREEELCGCGHMEDALGTQQGKGSSGEV